MGKSELNPGTRRYAQDGITFEVEVEREESGDVNLYVSILEIDGKAPGGVLQMEKPWGIVKDRTNVS